MGALECPTHHLLLSGKAYFQLIGNGYVYMYESLQPWPLKPSSCDIGDTSHEVESGWGKNVTEK